MKELAERSEEQKETVFDSDYEQKKRRVIHGAIDLTKGPVLSQFLRYAIPIILMGVLTSLYASADAVVLGQFAGKLAFSAVGATTAIIGLVVNSVISINVGVSVLTARAFGSGDDDRTRSIVGTSFVFGAALGVLLAVLGELFAPALLDISQCPAEVYDQALLYLRLYFIGVPAQLFYSIMNPLLAARGDSARPLAYMSISGLVNVLLNVIFVAFFKLDVLGVAVATIISQYLSVILLLFRLLRINDCSRLVLSKIKAEKPLVLLMLKLGIPASVSSASYAITNFMIQSAVNSYGPDGIAGNSAAGSIETYVFAIINAIIAATSTAIGQNLGAGNKDRVLSFRRTIYCSAFLSITALSFILILLSEPLLSIFVPGETEAIAFGKIRMVCILSAVSLYAIAAINGGILQAFGKTSVQMFLSLGCVCGVRVIWMLIVYPLAPSALLLFLGYPSGYVLNVIISMIVTGRVISKYKKSPLNLQ